MDGMGDAMDRWLDMNIRGIDGWVNVWMDGEMSGMTWNTEFKQAFCMGGWGNELEEWIGDGWDGQRDQQDGMGDGWIRMSEKDRWIEGERIKLNLCLDQRDEQMDGLRWMMELVDGWGERQMDYSIMQKEIENKVKEIT